MTEAFSAGLPPLPIFDELSQRKQWVAWHYVHKKEGEKPTKVPLNPRSGFPASVSDPHSWGTYDEAVQFAERRNLPGIGIVLTADDDITGIDLDNCMDDNGVLVPWVQEIVDLAETYAEVSPSGHGLRLIARGKVDKATVRNAAGIEIYARGRYLTLTGQHIALVPTEIREAPRTIAALLKRVEAMAPVAPVTPIPRQLASSASDTNEMEELLSYIPADCGYDEWLSVLMSIHAETNGAGFDIADRWSATGGKKYCGHAELLKKWSSFRGSGVSGATLAEIARRYGADLSAIAIRHLVPDVSPEEEAERKEVSASLLTNFLLRREEQSAERAKTEIEWFDDIAPVVSSPYMIKGFLDHGSMSVVYGPSNCGKTFFALDVAFHIATCPQWRDRRVTGGGVLYLAAEGGNGIANRIAALRETTGTLDVPFALRRAGLDLLNPKADTGHVIRLAAEVRERCSAVGLALIVIDTLSRVIAGGDENAASDMTAFIRNVDVIRKATGAHVMIVHHTGKDAAKGARGHSSLRAATDTEIEVSYDEEAGTRSAKVTKQRDYEGGETFCFSLKSVHLGVDQDGDDVSSCVLEVAEEPPEEQAEGLPPRAVCREILQAIDDAWKQRNPLSMANNIKGSGRHAPRVIGKRFNISTQTAQKLLIHWIDSGTISTEVCDQKTKKRGLQVLEWI